MLQIKQHNDGTVTIEGTRYSEAFFRELGCNFPSMVGQILRVERKEDGVITVTRLSLKDSDQLTDLKKALQAAILKTNRTVTRCVNCDPAARSTYEIDWTDEVKEWAKLCDLDLEKYDPPMEWR